MRDRKADTALPGRHPTLRSQAGRWLRCPLVQAGSRPASPTINGSPWRPIRTAGTCQTCGQPQRRRAPASACSPPQRQEPGWQGTPARRAPPGPAAGRAGRGYGSRSRRPTRHPVGWAAPTVDMVGSHPNVGGVCLSAVCRSRKGGIDSPGSPPGGGGQKAGSVAADHSRTEGWRAAHRRPSIRPAGGPAVQPDAHRPAAAAAAGLRCRAGRRPPACCGGGDDRHSRAAWT